MIARRKPARRKAADPKRVARMIAETICPNCEELVAVKLGAPKASCKRCGNVWAWKVVPRRLKAQEDRP